MKGDHRVRRRFAFFLAAAACALVAVPAALGAGPVIPAGIEVFGAKLNPVPHAPRADAGSNVRGGVGIVRTDTTVRVTVLVSGLDTGLPHMQHIHGIGLSQCPTSAADTSGDGLISLDEGLPFYGPVVVPLTLASNPQLYPTAGLRLPVGHTSATPRPGAPKNGLYLYKRVFVIGQDIPVAVANALEDYQVVVHGIDLDENGLYEAGEDLLPAACGTLSQVTGAAAFSALMLDRLGTFSPTVAAPSTPAPPVRGG